MSKERISLGKKGEELALKYLKRHKYKIIEQNYKSRFGEIDIIAKDEDVLAFIEVKTRKSTEFGSPQESVDIRKQRQLAKAALEYISKRKIRNTNCRFDVVGIICLPDQEPKIELIKNAFYIEE